MIYVAIILGLYFGIRLGMMIMDEVELHALKRELKEVRNSGRYTTKQ